MNIDIQHMSWEIRVNSNTKIYITLKICTQLHNKNYLSILLWSAKTSKQYKMDCFLLGFDINGQK